MTELQIKNRLNEVILERETNGFLFKPSNEFYRTIGIHKRRFGQFLRNEKEPTLDELSRIALKLSICPTELLKKQNPATTANSAGYNQSI